MSAGDATLWTHGRLGDLLPLKYGKSLPDRLRDPSGTVPVFGSSGRVGVHTQALTQGPALIVGRKGSVGSVYFSEIPCWPIDTVYFTEAAAGQNLRYFKYLLDSLRLVQLDKSTAVPGLSRDDYNAVTVAIAPPQQQTEIVAEIEKQFSRLDEAVANLQRVKANLKCYKTAVLSAAVEGTIVETEQILACSKGGTVESSDRLLQRILDARRNAWHSKGGYVEPVMIVPAGLPDLPEGWAWVPLGLLGSDPFNTVQTGPFGAQLHNTDFTESGVPVIAVGNLTGTGFRRDGLYFVDAAKAEQLSRYDVWAGDLLFARSGATLGKVCVAPPDVADWRMTGHILRARLNRQFIDPDVAVYALAAMPAVRRQVFGNVRGVTRPGFNTALLESIFIPVPPLAEQQRIVAEVERRLSIVREVEAEVDANLKRALALRQSVLTRAFSPPIN